MPYNSKTGLEYQGKNVGVLLSRGYSSLEWATFLQWREFGYKVRKGEKGTRCLTYGKTTKVNPLTGKRTTEGYRKGFVVFNSEQVERVTV